MYERIQGNDVYNAGPEYSVQRRASRSTTSLSRIQASACSVGYDVQTAPISVGSITGLAYTDYKSPASYQYSVGVQQQLCAESVLNSSLRRKSESAPERLSGNRSPVAQCSTAADRGNTVCPYNLQVPYLGFNSIKLSENAENSHYNGLQSEHECEDSGRA